MNAERRKLIENARNMIAEARSLLETARDEEQDYYENMPPSFQSGEKGDAAQAAAEKLGDCVDACEQLETDLDATEFSANG